MSVICKRVRDSYKYRMRHERELKLIELIRGSGLPIRQEGNGDRSIFHISCLVLSELTYWLPI